MSHILLWMVTESIFLRYIFLRYIYPIVTLLDSNSLVVTRRGDCRDVKIVAMQVDKRNFLPHMKHMYRYMPQSLPACVQQDNCL